MNEMDGKVRIKEVPPYVETCTDRIFQVSSPNGKFLGRYTAEMLLREGWPVPELLAGPPGEPSTTIDTPEQAQAILDAAAAQTAAVVAVEQAFPGTTETEGADQ